MAAYQAADGLCQHFDKVMVINHGQQIYYGPVSEAASYFESLGFERLPGTTLSDFLTLMTGDQASWTPKQDHIGPLPRTVDEMSTAFRRSPCYEIPDFETKNQASAPSSPPSSPSRKPAEYTLPAWRQAYLCTIRQFQILITDKASWITEGVATVVQALVIGTIFFNERNTTQSLYSIGSAMFLSVLTVALRAAAELRATFSQRPLLLKQKQLRFYRPGKSWSLTCFDRQTLLGPVAR